MTTNQISFVICILLGLSIGGCANSTNEANAVAENGAEAAAMEPNGETEILTDPAGSIDGANGSKQATAPDLSTPPSSQSELSNSDSETQDPDQPELPSLEDVEKNPIDTSADPYRGTAKKIEEKQTIDIPDTWKRLSKEYEIWIDTKNKVAIAAGNICLRAGPLEVFACPRGTKEHEAIVSVNALSSLIHTTLLALGATPGRPVVWQDKYQPATGPVIHIDVVWKAQNGEQKRVKAQQLVRDFKTQKPMEYDWVFGGSQTFTDQETGETYYYGDSGELVCLSNFATATMDVPVQSSDANEGLLFEANTPNIPEVNTKVYLIFRPELDKKVEQKIESPNETPTQQDLDKKKNENDK